MPTIARELLSRFTLGPSGNRLRGPIALGMLAAISIGLSACNPADALRGLGKEDPATVCASSEMRQQLIKLIATNDADVLATAFRGSKIEPKIFQRAAKYWETGDANVELIVLESVDPTTNKISCSGQFILKVPTDAVTSEIFVSPPGSTMVEAAIKFSRQPSADGKSYVYRYEDPSNAIAIAPTVLFESMGREKAIRAKVAAEAAAREDASTEIAPESEAPMADEEDSDQFDASKFVTSAACQQAAESFDDGLQCAELRKKEEDVELAAALSVAKSRVSQAESAKLDQAQTRWVRAREEECDAEGQKDAAVFSTYAAINNNCHFERNEARLRELAAYPPRRK